IQKAVGTAVDVALEVLDYSTELLQLAPVPGLQEAVETVLKIANAAKLVSRNRKECERLAQRCVAVMLSVRQEVKQSGDQVTQELQVPISELIVAFAEVYRFLQGHGHNTAVRQWLNRQEVAENLRICDRKLDSSLSMFSVSATSAAQELS
ncbi:hypothetical protein OBBRIDRAFT_735019, partial [Obba rivulosa]